jgi:hypothetical protein
VVALSRSPRAAGACSFVVALIVATASGFAHADAGWFESGDTALRTDLQLLNDARVIRLPMSHWPIPRAAVREAMANSKAHFATNSAVSLALARVRARIGDGPRFSFDARGTVGEQGTLRDFDTLGRENGELSAGAKYSAGRFAASVRVAGALSPDDDQSARVDQSHATVALGNWLVSANTLDRWWGPGFDGSLILSNNARPMPTLMVERAAARPFDLPVLRLLGPWRFSLGVSQMESNRQDIDSPLFFAWRVTIMPLQSLELGFSRTAQFCGKQLACDLSSITDMLIGNDNIGIDATEESEPGNQMAGFDMRWASPIGNGPYAVYGQMIGEDESSYLPVKFLEQFGAEVWHPFADGGIVRVSAEYADTTCSAGRSVPRFNCAYNQGLFNVEGYRYRGRVIGHTTDRDSETYSLQATYTAPDGELWTAATRYGFLNRDRNPDFENTVAGVRTEFSSLEVGWRRQWKGLDLAVDLGVESRAPEGAGRDTGAFGYLSIKRGFYP